MSAPSRSAFGQAVSRVGLLVVILGLGCNTEPCACPPAASALLFFGQVLTASGEPIEAAAVTVTLGAPTCAFPATGPPSQTAATGSDGRFRTRAELGVIGGEACIRITAHRAGLAGELIASNEGVLVRFPRAVNGVDSVGFVLRAQQ